MQNFLRWDRSFIDKVLSGELSFMEYAYLNWISCKANPFKGELITNCSAIAKETRQPAYRVKYYLDGLKDKGYVDFNFKQGQRVYSKIVINSPPYGNLSEVGSKNKVKSKNFSEVVPEVNSNNINSFLKTDKKASEVSSKNRSNFKNFSEVDLVNTLKSKVSETLNIKIYRDKDTKKKSDKSDYEILELARSFRKLGYSKEKIIQKLNNTFCIPIKKLHELENSFFKD